MKISKILYAASLLVVLIATGCAIDRTDSRPIYYTDGTVKNKPAKIPMIKVLLSHHKGQSEISMRITPDAKFYISDSDDDLVNINALPEIVNVNATDGGFSLKGADGFIAEIPSEYFRVTVPEKKIELMFPGDESLTILGDLVIAKSKNNPATFDIIVRTDLETYCAQVLFNEMPESFDKEALKAQSVATRTYALYKILENSPEERNNPWSYDLENTQQDTVFNPSMLKPEAQEICKSTFGEVITANDLDGNPRIFPAYYHSTCGGATASAWDAQGTFKNLEPLQGVKTDFCQESPIYSWKRTYSWLNWRQLLIDKQYTTEHLAKELSGFEISDKDMFGRARKFKFTFDGKSDVEIQAIVFRNKVVGPGKTEGQLPSVFITSIKLNGDTIDLEGNGWGHGCGMCQWGANKLSRDGTNYKDILQIYYTGSEIWGYYK